MTYGPSAAPRLRYALTAGKKCFCFRMRFARNDSTPKGLLASALRSRAGTTSVEGNFRPICAGAPSIRNAQVQFVASLAAQLPLGRSVRFMSVVAQRVFGQSCRSGEGAVRSNGFSRFSYKRRSEAREAVHDAICACRVRTASDAHASSRRKHGQMGPPLTPQ